MGSQAQTQAQRQKQVQGQVRRQTQRQTQKPKPKQSHNLCPKCPKCHKCQINFQINFQTNIQTNIQALTNPPVDLPHSPATCALSGFALRGGCACGMLIQDNVTIMESGNGNES